MSDEKKTLPSADSHAANFDLAVDSFIDSASKISANMLGLVNRVGGQIFALLFLSRKPRSLDEIGELLKISKSNVSVNIRLLEDYKLVRKCWQKGSRKDYYEACRDSPRQLLRDFFDRMRSGIDESIRLINKCQDQFQSLKPSSSETKEDVEFIYTQLKNIALFYHGASQLFEDFYQGRAVNIELLRRVIFD